jgi:hypothetical protein
MTANTFDVTMLYDFDVCQFHHMFYHIRFDFIQTLVLNIV